MILLSTAVVAFFPLSRALLGGGSSHIYFTLGKWTGCQYGWMVLRGHCGEGGKISLTLLLSLLETLTAGLTQLAVGEKTLVGELGLVLEPDPVPCLVVLHCVLQDHEF